MHTRRWRRSAASGLVAVLVTASLLAGCGDDPKLDRQEAKMRAQTCATLTERDHDVPVTVPSSYWFILHASERADSQPTDKGRKRGNPTELKDDCKIATGHLGP